MLSKTLVLLSSLLWRDVFAQTAASVYSEPGVPTGTPVPGDYSGALRPQIHFSPPQGFMNDPNGMFLDDTGLFHLYYQYNPTDTIAGNQHWGHATTRDGYTFTNEPIALFPPSNTTFVFSGSAVVDSNNTSGFFPNQTNGVVAVFTLSGTLQTQDIAYSRDGGYTFEYYKNNPVLDINSTQFRDPKVFWYPATQSWAMAVSYAADFVIGIYTSPNLKDWTHASNFSHHGLLGIQYECPNLVEMPVKDSDETMWLMYISINPGAPVGGSIGQYFPGSFNGTHFTAVDQVTRIDDFAKDNYAGQFFSGIPGTEKQISMAWASNWQYTGYVPTGPLEGWASAMTVPRYNHLEQLPGIGWVLVQAPYDITSQFERELAYNSSLKNGSVFIDYSRVESKAIYFEANITGLNPDILAGTLNFTASSSVSGEMIQGGTTVNGATWLSRQRVLGFENPFFTDKFSSNGVYSGSQNGSWTISGIVDRTILELFVNGGQQRGTMLFFPNTPLDTLWIGAGSIPENASVSVGVWALKDAWAEQENSNGTVVGNVTSSLGYM